MINTKHHHILDTRSRWLPILHGHYLTIDYSYFIMNILEFVF